jgi:DNA-directed RNA polymerase subunit RPC12/RpoP
MHHGQTEYVCPSCGAVTARTIASVNLCLACWARQFAAELQRDKRAVRVLATCPSSEGT